MSEALTILLPQDINDDVVASVQNDLSDMAEVESAGTTTTRSIDAASIMMWVTLAADAIGVVGAAVDLCKRIAGRLKDKHVHGAVIELPNGTRISIDHASADQISELVREWKEEEA